MNTLYHYVHCPFCIRVRLVLGLLNIKYNSVVLPYNDELTPVDLMGVKMLPIFKFSDESISNESLDIIVKLDKLNLLKTHKLQEPQRDGVEDLLSKIGADVHCLCMPYWMWTPEFDNESRKYFQDKKEVKRGPFKNLIKNKQQYITGLNATLDILSKEISTFYKSESLSIFDIMIASHLWGMYIFPEYQFPKKIHDYLQMVAKTCNFNYHEDFWR